MNHICSRIPAALFAAAVLTQAAHAQAPQAARPYIVVFHDQEPDVDRVTADHERSYGAAISHRYYRAVKGYAGAIPVARLDDIRRDPRVAFVSEDRVVTAVAQTPPTGVDRIDAELSSHASSNAWTIGAAGSWSSVVCGIDWVTSNATRLNIKVANMSLGGSGSDDGNCGLSNGDALHKAICNSVAAGVTYVVAAGNDGRNLAGFVPAAYDEVLAVTAVADFNGQPGGGAAATCRTGVDDTPADFSNFAGIDTDDANHTIAAPGVCIRSTWKGGSYQTISGTSMASPHTTGAAALCIAAGTCAGGRRRSSTGCEPMLRSRDPATDSPGTPTARSALGTTGILSAGVSIDKACDAVNPAARLESVLQIRRRFRERRRSGRGIVGRRARHESCRRLGGPCHAGFF